VAMAGGRRTRAAAPAPAPRHDHPHAHDADDVDDAGARRARVDGDRLDRILGGLRTQGGRVTASRRIITTALLDAPHHVTADELIAAVQATHPEIAPSTVYRTLHALADLGVVRPVHVGEGPAVYHLADDRHHHLVCRSCGTVTEAPDDLLAAAARRVRRDHGFVLDDQSVALLGVCARCAPTPSP
jgi:Fur family transcriptional regulator, ferric uptake regulator